MSETTHATPPPDDGFDALDVCHRRILLALGQMSALIARLASFGPDREARAMAQEVEGFFSKTVRQHHEDEERFVFPQVVARGDREMAEAILRLQQDHNWLEEDWMELSPHLAAVAQGQSWYDLDLLREGTAVFTALLHDHIALEESVIYPASREQATVAERRAMGREMAARRRGRTAASPG